MFIQKVIISVEWFVQIKGLNWAINKKRCVNISWL